MQAIELRSSPIPSADTVCVAGRQYVPLRYWQAMEWLGGVEEPDLVIKLHSREPGDPRDFRKCI